MWLLGERLEELSTRANALFKDLENSIHVVGLDLEHRLAKSLHEVSQQLVFLHFMFCKVFIFYF